jgi:hypothetical protein
VLTLLVWLNTFIVVKTPINWLIQNLLDTKSLHFSFVFEDVIQDALSDGVEVVLVDLIKHCVNEVLNSFLLNGMEISWNELDDESEPVLSDCCNDIN